MQELTIKELYDVFIKTTYPLEIDGEIIETGETIANFDKIQVARVKQRKKITAATGGKNNSPRVLWDDTYSVEIDFTQGIFTKFQLALLSNSRLNSSKENEFITIPKKVQSETDENGIFKFSPDEKPYGKFFVYDSNTGKKLQYIKIDDITYQISKPFLDIQVFYNYVYEKAYKKLTIGKELYQGFLCLEGKTKTVDDITGNIKTSLICFPRIKITSAIELTLGDNVSPNKAQFSAIAFPIKDDGDIGYTNMYFLEHDIDSDI